MPSILNKFNKFYLAQIFRTENILNLPINLVLEAITAQSALDICNYERLEILGDSVLKYLTSVYLFSIFPDDPEGTLTAKRTEIISNNRLFKLALKLKIYQYAQIKSFNTKNWVAPGLEELYDNVDIINTSEDET